MKSVLVGILTYNHEKYIAECIESAFNQTYPCTVYVTDDASNDNTKGIIARYSSVHSTLHTENSGNLLRAYNDIISFSKPYDYLFFISGDDVLLNDSIEILVKHAEESSADWVYGGLNLIDADGVQIDTWTYDGFPESVPNAIAYMWKKKGLGTTTSALFSTKFLKDKPITCFPNTTFSPDASMAIDWYASWPKICRVRHQVMKFRIHNGQHSSYLGHEREQMEKDLTEKMLSVFGYSNIIACS